MLMACPYCGSTDVGTLEVGDDQMPDLMECEAPDCEQQFEDPDHINAG